LLAGGAAPETIVVHPTWGRDQGPGSVGQMTATASTSSILGNRVVRSEDPKFLTSGGVYVDDIALEGAAFATYVRSPFAHARVTGIDVSEARNAPGVLGLFTAADLDLGLFPLDMAMLPATMPRTFLATDVVRFVGEPIAVVVTEERYQGEDAAALVIVDYDPLPVVLDVEASLEGDTLLHPDAGTNVCFAIPDDPVDLSDCEVVVRHRLMNRKVAPCPLEVRAAAARWTDEGRLEHWAGCQGAHPVRDSLAAIYGLEPTMVRVIAPDTGGGFGARGFVYPEEMLCGWLASRVGRAVRWTESRSESMLGFGHGRGQVQDITIGGTRAGKVLAYQLDIVQDSGAYPRISAILPFLTKMMLSGTYAIERASCRARSVVTNTVPMVAYRGAGRPEAAAAIERAIDLFAAEIGMDPAEVRRINLVPEDAFPFTNSTGTTYDSGRYERALDLVLDAAGYADLRAEQSRRRLAGDRVQLGIGLSVYVEITALQGGTEFGRVEIRPDGGVRALTGTSPHGQGHVTSWQMLISERTGIPMDQIEVVYGDTDVVPKGGLTGGSRSLQLGGTSIWNAAGHVVDQARDVAAHLLEAHPDDIVLEGGTFHVAGAPALGRTWAEVASAAETPLAAEGDTQQAGGTFPCGAHLAVVEVDMETGHVRLVRLVAVDDAGRILNPLLAEGQVHGGLAQGTAQALFEEVVYDDDGNPLTSNLADYTFISAAELPSFETIHLETPTALNELGAKGIGESGSVGSTPAVQNAVVDALSYLGVRHVEMPCTPERVWREISHARAS
jgi:carbon-monoxide dehydrogenase large subunit